MARDPVSLDLNSPEFLDTFLGLEAREMQQVTSTLRKVRGMDWSSVYRAPGLKWEKVDHISSPSGGTVYSLRCSDKVRALVYRDGKFMRFLSLHPDHDAAYRK
ncbi:MAG: hypothetical protein ABIJ09_25910 [Pseudomonadota bacterium]